MATEANEPAFGYSVPADEKAGWLSESIPGLNKREYFAAAAMQGMCANISIRNQDELLETPSKIAQWATSLADALIEQLNKKTL